MYSTYWEMPEYQSGAPVFQSRATSHKGFCLPLALADELRGTACGST